MARTPFEPPLILSPLDREGTALPRQLATQLRQCILGGRLTPGANLPATRQLALQLQVSRNTVIAAYDQLLAEGFLVARRGSATQVAPLPVPNNPLDMPAARPISRRATTLLGTAKPRGQMWHEALVPGIPDVEHFPWVEWSRLLARRWRRPGHDLLLPDNSAGYPPLRAAIATWLGRSRGVRCSPDQIMIVSGSQQALDLTARVLLDPGDTALIEDPCYGGLKGVLQAAGAKLAPWPVDKDGFDIQAAERRWPEARMAWVTPSHQFPTGTTMPANRRVALVDWVRRRQGWIIEDDYDSDFCHSGRPLTAVQGIDSDQRTLHIGTFSKSMFPGLRLGWLVLPRDLLPAFLSARRLADVAPPSLTQAAMADFMVEGLFARHLKRMRSLYASRQAIFTQACQRHLAPFGVINPGTAGLHSVLWLKPEWDDSEAAARAAAADIPVPCLSALSEAPGRPGLILGWSHILAEHMDKAVARLAAALGSAPP